MKPVLKLGVLCLTFVISATACRKNDDDDNNNAGKGGSARLVATLAHHNITKNITNAKVFIKYNTSDAPGNGVYDDSADCMYINTVATAIFDSMKPGNYYLYGRGYDTSIAQTVLGGIKYDVVGTAAQIDTVHVPVTEGD
jgi:hypothetical protein